MDVVEKKAEEEEKQVLQSFKEDSNRVLGLLE